MAMARRFSWHRLTAWLLGGITCWIVVWGAWVHQPAASQSAELALPTRQIHVLPEALLNWQDRPGIGDYFDQLEPLEFGALVWSRFPVHVYIEPSVNEVTLPNAVWLSLVEHAVQAWQLYLPLQITQSADAADVTIRPVAPPLQLVPQPEQTPGQPPRLSIGRVRSAEARYQLYLKTFNSGKKQLIHRCSVNVNPRQAHDYLYTALLHELGHTLGLWGHSQDPRDTMYFSQVQQPDGISDRDINTLKRVYQQPTQLGWVFP
jgi:predicted Zn-dependent protease